MWLGNSKAVIQGQSFHYCQLIQALMPTITSLFLYELVPIESYPSIESIQNPNTDYSNRHESIWHLTTSTWYGTCVTRTSSTPACSTSKPHTANCSQRHSERSEDEHTIPLYRRQKETRRVSYQNQHVSHHEWGYIQQQQLTNHILYEG